MDPTITGTNKDASRQTSPTEVVEFPDNRLAALLCGALDSHLKLMELRLGVALHPVGGGVVITAPRERARKVRTLLETLYASLERGHPVDQKCIEAGILTLTEKQSLVDIFSEQQVLKTPRLALHPRTPQQAAYIRTLLASELTFAIGPAGTGKTFLAVAVAIVAYLEGRVARVILSRPAVEAGERLGFLPGDIQAKVDPYLRPLFDALHDMLGAERVLRLLDRKAIEIAPLAFMRGRTLEEAYIILDEAQNTTTEQMKMFLTRLGEGSQMAVLGDITQVDLPRGTGSGLIQAHQRLQNVQGVAFVHFSEHDVVRHPLVRRIVQAYEQADRHSHSSGK